MEAYPLMQRMEDAATMYRTLIWDLPLALAQYGGGNGEEREAVETAVKITEDASVLQGNQQSRLLLVFRLLSS